MFSFSWPYWLSAVFILLQTNSFGIVDRLVYGEWSNKPGDKITQGLNLITLLINTLLFSRKVWRTQRLETGEILALALAIFLLFSAAWSIDPETTIRRGILYLIFIVGVIGVADVLNAAELMELLCRVCFLSAIASIVLRVVSPAQALMGDGGEWRGVFSHKNFLGEVMAMGVLASLHMLRAKRRGRVRRLCMLLVMVLVALAARSGTATLTIFAFCYTERVIALIRSGGFARIVGAAIVVFSLPIVCFVAFNFDWLMDLLGKDPTLTGRTVLWTYVVDYIGQRPWFGWGFFAFWSAASPAANEISDLLGWSVPEAHNGLLEMLLEVGIIGTGLFVFVWARNLLLAVKCLRAQEGELGVSALLCCMGIVLVGITELVLVDPSWISVSVFFVTGLMCERAVWGTRRRRYHLPAPPRPSGMPHNLKRPFQTDCALNDIR